MNPPRHPNELFEGNLVRGFRIVRWLGAGSFAFMFLVERGGSRYSLKMSTRPSSPADEDKVEAWRRREVASWEHLEHPNLLPVLEWGRWPDPETGYSYFVTPYVCGSTFHAWRQQKRASLDRSVSVLCEFLKVLEALHERGVCHGDIKAENILVRWADDRPFLIDFSSVPLPWVRVPVEAHPVADLYVFGVLLYETLTQCRPFGTRLPLEQMLCAIASVTPPRPRELEPRVPEALSALAMRLLEKEPQKRPTGARAVRMELQRIQKEEGHTWVWRQPARRPGEAARSRALSAGVEPLAAVMEEFPVPDPPRLQVAPVPAESPPSDPPRRAGGRPGWFAALVLALGALGMGWMLHRVVYFPPRQDCSCAEPAMPAPRTR
ncbi:serine/threonine protein kinase [Archangium lansingense]|uniref:Phosphotransferase n=1 Tax=Archangium lansingense TaxID=2995310 RepID=A0ABT4ALX2_9BACT|nr:protein kinase [Archangium lansinium]MCY1082710.1 phosphotransferase [Archangium lansinium]